MIPELHEEDVKYFMNKLPDITNLANGVHLEMLAARSRKAREMLGIKIHDLVVERSIVRGIYNTSEEPENVAFINNAEWKTRWFDRIYNYHVLQHAGKHDYGKFNEETKQYVMHQIPAQAMGIFATISPRDVLKATKDIMNNNIGYIIQQRDLDIRELSKISSRMFGCLHKHKLKGYNYVTIDIDDPSIYEEARDMCTPFPIWIINRTSRGYHIVLDLCREQDAMDFYGKSKVVTIGGRKQKIQDGTHYKLQEKFKGQFDFQHDAQEPVSGSLYYKTKDALNYVEIIQ